MKSIHTSIHRNWMGLLIFRAGLIDLIFRAGLIDLFHKSHNVPVQYSTMHQLKVKLYCQISNISSILVGNQPVDHCSWSIACRLCFPCIFILNLTLGFNGLCKGIWKTRRETFTFWDLVSLISGSWRQFIRYYHAHELVCRKCCIQSQMNHTC